MMELDQEEAPSGAPTWMVTFADLMSLLLTFFVLLLSFSTMEVVKFRQAMSSIQDAFGLRSPDDVSDAPSGSTPIADNIGAGLTPELLEQQLEEVLEQVGLQAKGEALKTPNGVILLVEGDLMFPSGESELSPETLPLLGGIAKYIMKVKGRVDVVGHTDNRPISTPVFPSNWELSAARAGQAVRYLVEQGVEPKRLRAIGQAETVPITSNETEEGRARNRRIEFIFSEQGSEDMPTTSPGELVESTSSEASVH